MTNVDIARWPHVYTGPPTPWGLERNTPCRIVGSQGGGKVVLTPLSTTTFIVAKIHLKKAGV